MTVQPEGAPRGGRDNKPNKPNKPGKPGKPDTKFEPLSAEEIAAKFGQAYIIMEQDPGLKQWFLGFARRYNEARGEISYETFNLELQQQPWWRNNSATYIADLRQELENPVDYEQGLASSIASLRAQANRIGATGVSEAVLRNLAIQQRRLGLNEQQTIERLADLISPVEGGDFRGVAGDVQTELLQWARSNGLTLNQGSMQEYVRRIATGATTVDDVKDDLRKTYLAGMYPAWADKINEGLDPSVLFEPYRNTAANLLEMSEISLDDPIMKRAAQYVGPDGKPSQLPLYQFEQEVRKDPRWQYTDNAYSTYTRVGTDLLRMFGFR